MSLTQEYIRKINCLKDYIPKRMYHMCDSVGFEGFVTREKLTLEQAAVHEKVPFAEGTKWGRKWEYGWFFTKVTIPESCIGKQVVFKAELGECLVFVNGKVYGSLDREHPMIVLTQQAEGGGHFDIAMEVYAGHGGHDGIPETANVVPTARVLIPENDIREFPEDVEQKTVRNGQFGIFHEEVFQFWMDLQTLYYTRECFDDNYWPRVHIDKCLKKICDIVDMEADFDVFVKQLEDAGKIAQPVLACRNGTGAPTLYAVGNSHLDLEWLWTTGETRRKAARTLGNQLRLIEQYDDYIYTHSQPWLLASVKQDYPELYEEIKQRVSEGRVIVEGGMWVEADTNIPSGESLIRQFIAGKQFISEEFGTESEILWLPDIFGCSAALPQIMKGCGIRYLMNAKISWLYDSGERFPHSTFLWQGLGDSEVLTHVTGDYPSSTSPGNVKGKWCGIQEKEDVPTRPFLFGHGDGGGGATRIHMEYLKRERDFEGLPKVVCASPNEFFHFAEKECEVTKKYKGELYFPSHRGTYTSQAKTKKGNRQSEQALREAELWTALLGKDCSIKKDIDALWKDVLFNQFHDILPGTAITAVYEKTEAEHKKVIEKAGEITDHTLSMALEPADDTLTLFNSLSWQRRVPVKLPEGYQGVHSKDGGYQETQYVDGAVWALLEVPSCGAESYRLCRTDIAEDALTDEELYLENNLIRGEFNEQGELVSVLDKETGMEFLSGASNRFRIYRDMPTLFDAWDIERTYEQVEEKFSNEADVTVECRGSLMSSLVIRKKILDSEVVQRVILRKDSRRLDFETEIDWRETHKLLKVDFNTNIHTDELISEIQFGHIKRPNHKNRQHDADRFEVCQHKWSVLTEGSRGLAVLNDCKYGISADEGRMSLTLLKSAAAPALYADKGVHHFTYSVMPFTKTFFESSVVQEAYELNYPAIVKMGETGTQSLLRVSEKNVIVETVKFAEDGSGDLIIRLYESQNTYTCCRLSFGFDVQEVAVTDMLEKKKRRIEVQENSVVLAMKAFEIVTLRVKSQL